MIPQPITVFISSCMRSEELRIVRQHICEEVDRTGLFRAWAFERHGASSIPAKEDYLLGVHESEVCVFVVESEFAVTEAMQSEIDEARSLGRKSFFYFYKRSPDERIALQEVLCGPEHPTTFEVSSLDKLPKQIVGDLQYELTRIYRLVDKDFSYQSLLAGGPEALVADATWEDAIVGKTPVVNYPKTKAFFAKFAFGIDSPASSKREIVSRLAEKSPASVSKNDLDDCCALLLEVVLGNRTMKEFNVAILHDEIDSQLPREYAEVSRIRWRAIQSYYLGDVQAAMRYMREAHGVAVCNGVAEWLIDDLLIDLRNLDAMQRGVVASIGEYQQQLSEKDKPLVYPVADRFNSEMYGALIDESYKRAQQSASTVVIGNDVTRFLDSLAGLTMVSVLYGSLTYIRLIPAKLRRVVYIVNLQYPSSRLERVMMKLALAGGDIQDARNLLNAYGEMTKGLNAAEADEAFNFVEASAAGSGRNNAIREAFSVFGSYMSDMGFEAALAIVRDIVENSLIDDSLPENSLSCLMANAPRIADNEWLLDVCQRAMKRGPRTLWNEEGIKMLASGSFMLDELDKSSAETALALVGATATDDQSAKEKLASVLSLFRRDNRYVERVDALAHDLPELCRMDYEINWPDCDFADLPRVIKSCISRIRSDNETQGVGGAYTYGLDNYIIVEYAAEAVGSIPDELLIESAKVCFETLHAQRQTIASKCRALRLLVFLDGASRSAHDLIKSQIGDTQLPEAGLWHISIIGGPYEQSLAIAELSLLRAAVLEEEGINVRTGISVMLRANAFSQIKFAEFVARMARSGLFVRTPPIESSRIVAILQVMAENPSHEVSVSAYRTLACLIDDANFGREVVAMFCEAFDNAGLRVKHAILNALESHPECFAERADALWAKAYEDSNYYIRMRAVKRDR